MRGLTIELSVASGESRIVANWFSFDAHLRHNKVDDWQIELPRGGWVGDNIRTRGARLRVWSDLGAELVSGPVGRTRNKVTDGDERLVARGFDDTVFLRQEPAHPEPASTGPPYNTDTFDTRTGPAGSVIIGYVDANVGPSAIPTRRVAGLTLAPDLGLGPTITFEARFQCLLNVVAGIANTHGLGFRFVDRAFEVFTPVDRTAVARFSTGKGNLAGWEDVDEPPGANYVYMLGSGEGTAQTVVELQDAVSVVRWGRVAGIANKGDASSTAILEEAAAAELTAKAAQAGTTIDVVDTDEVMFGRDYNLGDRVAAFPDGNRVEDVVREVRISARPDRIAVGASIGSIPATGADTPRLFDRVADLETRLRNLERQ